MITQMNYLKTELYKLIQMDPTIFEFLQSGSLDGIWYWDLEKMENEWMSPQFWITLGYNPDKKKHKANEWQDLINPEDLQIALENFEKHCADPNHPYDQVVRYKHRDGSLVWVRCRGIVICDNAGKPIRMLGAHTDLTAQKNAEEALYLKTVQLEKTNIKLQDVLDNIKILKGLLPICSHCKKVRDDKGYWANLDAYIEKNSETTFSHSICQDCAKKHYSDYGLYDD